jgi:hypothetical protein
MAKRTHSHPVPWGKIQTRFEPSHLANGCLADAYLRLVPVVWRPLRSSTPGLVAPTAVSRERQQQHEEGRQCR